jgi:hypothetical protein
MILRIEKLRNMPWEMTDQICDNNGHYEVDEDEGAEADKDSKVNCSDRVLTRSLWEKKKKK